MYTDHAEHARWRRRSRAEELREQIGGLSESLSQVEIELSRLQITRETMSEVHQPRQPTPPAG